MASEAMRLSTRDYQAMYNFCTEGISYETIAEHFHCSAALVYEMVTTRPWLHPPATRATINLDWIQSDHSDPLELAKTFYPHALSYISPDSSLEITTKEVKSGYVYDWEVHFEKEYGHDDGSVRFDMTTFFQEPI